MKLFVDDEREAPEGWILARDVETAIRLIAHDNDVGSEISLDHDAGIAGTFQPVAYFIGEKYNNGAHDLVVTVHSANPVGSKRMREILESYSIFI